MLMYFLLLTLNYIGTKKNIEKEIFISCCFVFPFFFLSFCSNLYIIFHSNFLFFFVNLIDFVVHYVFLCSNIPSTILYLFL
jgi:hypothetical protein